MRASLCVIEPRQPCGQFQCKPEGSQEDIPLSSAVVTDEAKVDKRVAQKRKSFLTATSHRRMLHHN